MKANNILVLLVGLFLAVSCNDGYIDDISSVSPGADEEAPEIAFGYPIEGTQFRVVADVAPIDITLAASDDIEVQQIKVSIDGVVAGTFTEFIDYRNAHVAFTQPNLTNGDHTMTVEVKDVAGKTTTESINFKKVPPYNPIYADEGEMFYMHFDGDYTDQVTITNATKVGLPGFSNNSISGRSYAGASSAYLTFPLSKLTLGTEFSAVFWYKINASPDRAGIISISGPNLTNPGDNDLTTGFRFFREGNATNQTFKLNVGFGPDGAWFDGGATASINPVVVTDWIHIAFTISETKCVVYINGAIVKEGTFDGIVWPTGTVLSIGSGMPNFKAWDHLSDNSLIDELRLFDTALTQAQIQAIIAAEED